MNKLNKWYCLGCGAEVDDEERHSLECAKLRALPGIARCYSCGRLFEVSIADLEDLGEETLCSVCRA